ncbi:MAG: L-histidine N(alpha)-methyltransferase [Candidatus Eremiobacteraeota bacterium]|nr:L-histidine N(alpha)-methyltransferase [Candidatus Eremiobacteraeota bacterium]
MSTTLVSISERFALHRDPRHLRAADFAGDVRTGLLAKPKRLPPKYFYDDLGSALFEAITHLPEYYLTRAERALLENHAGEIVATAGARLELVELGSGSASKTRRLIEAALARQATLRYSPIDISEGALVASSQALVDEYPQLTIEAYASDYVGLLAGGGLRISDRVLALFLGSNIGNYEPNDAAALLRALGSALRSGDALLLGTDMKKSIERLELAYDDPAGVTAAFDKNLLGRINRELSGGFDLRTFEHEAHYDPVRGAVDSFLVSQIPQRVAIRALDLEIAFAELETIHTESSYKYSPDDVERLANETGYRVGRRWTDPAGDYALNLLFVA